MIRCAGGRHLDEVAHAQLVGRADDARLRLPEARLVVREQEESVRALRDAPEAARVGEIGPDPSDVRQRPCLPPARWMARVSTPAVASSRTSSLPMGPVLPVTVLRMLP